MNPFIYLFFSLLSLHSICPFTHVLPLSLYHHVPLCLCLSPHTLFYWLGLSPCEFLSFCYFLTFSIYSYNHVCIMHPFIYLCLYVLSLFLHPSIHQYTHSWFIYPNIFLWTCQIFFIFLSASLSLSIALTFSILHCHLSFSFLSLSFFIQHASHPSVLGISFPLPKVKKWVTCVKGAYLAKTVKLVHLTKG